MARGRKRKNGAREPNGRPQRAKQSEYINQQEADNLCVVVDARSRHNGVSRENARDQNWGHTLGALMLRNVIDKRQMTAGNSYMEEFFRYCRLKGFPPRNAKVASYAQMIAGMASGHIPDDETVKSAEQRLKDAQTAVVDALGWQQSIPAFSALETFAVNQEHYGQCTPSKAGPLRQCLNALAHHYGV